MSLALCLHLGKYSSHFLSFDFWCHFELPKLLYLIWKSFKFCSKLYRTNLTLRIIVRVIVIQNLNICLRRDLTESCSRHNIHVIAWNRADLNIVACLPLIPSIRYKPIQSRALGTSVRITEVDILKRVPNHGSLTLSVLSCGKISSASISQIILWLCTCENAWLILLFKSLKSIIVFFRWDPICTILLKIKAGWHASIWTETPILLECTSAT